MNENKRLIRSIRIKGAYYYKEQNGYKLLKSDSIKSSSSIELTLEAEPSNRHDPKAIQIKYFGYLIGYVPKEETQVIHAMFRVNGQDRVQLTFDAKGSSFTSDMLYANLYLLRSDPVCDDVEDDEDDEDYVPVPKPNDEFRYTHQLAKLKQLMRDPYKSLDEQIKAHKEFDRVLKLKNDDEAQAAKVLVALKAKRNAAPKNLCMEVPEPTKKPYTLNDLRAKLAGVASKEQKEQKEPKVSPPEPKTSVDPFDLLGLGTTTKKVTKPVVDDFL